MSEEQSEEQRPASTAGSDRSQESVPVGGKLQVLLVDDHELNRKVAKSILENRFGYRVATAENGLVAIEQLTRSRFDLVLMDIQMPVMNGIEALRRIRTGGEVIDPGIPVIAFTAYALPEERHDFFAKGMDGFVAKPFFPEELRAEIERAMAKRPERP